MIHLLEFYSLHLILYPKLVSISSSIPSSAFLPNSYAACQNTFLWINTYMFSRVQLFIIIIIIIIYLCVIIMTWLSNPSISYYTDILLDFEHLISMTHIWFSFPLFRHKIQKTNWLSYNMYFLIRNSKLFYGTLSLTATKQNFNRSLSCKSLFWK